MVSICTLRCFLFFLDHTTTCRTILGHYKWIKHSWTKLLFPWGVSFDSLLLFWGRGWQRKHSTMCTFNFQQSTIKEVRFELPMVNSECVWRCSWWQRSIKLVSILSAHMNPLQVLFIHIAIWVKMFLCKNCASRIGEKTTETRWLTSIIHYTVHLYNPTSLWPLC